MNRRTLTLGALTASLLAAVAPIASAQTDVEALQRASERGRLIYAYDQAAWISSDEMFKRVRDPDSAGVRGYVIEPAAEGLLRAIYYRLDGDTPKAVFTAEVRGRTLVSSRLLGGDDNPNLSPLAIRLVRARAAAVVEAEKQKLAPCAPAPFNTVVLPPGQSNGPVAVYLLTPQVKAGEYPFGGHYEIDVAADGSIAASRPFTKSCLTMSVVASNAPPGARPAGVGVSHVLDPRPTEIHVYLSLWMGEPVFVATGPDSVWRVDADRIALEQNAPAR